MPRYPVRARGTINARPQVIWDILTDYETMHPLILPKGFSPLQIQRGGKGAGTIIRFSVHVLGTTQEYRGEVSTLEPGQVLVETYPTNDPATTFTVTPLENGQAADVQISTDMSGRAGSTGTIERAMTRLVMGRLYREELGKLAALAESRSAASQSVD